MSTLDELVTPLSTADFQLLIYNALAASGVTTTTWKPGAVVRTIIAACAIMLAALSTLISLVAKSSFLALATDEWLRLVAFYFYGVIRIEATFATGSVTLINTSGNNYDLDPGDLVLQNPISLKTYVNAEAIALGPTSTLSGVVVAATEVGSASTSFSGEISKVVTALTGVSCSNPTAVIGADVEEDSALRLRCTEKLGSLSPNGPPDAYAFVARGAIRLDGSAIGITRVRTIPDGLGGMDLYLATSTGGITGTVGDLSSDLGAVDDAVQKLATPLCVTVRTHSATPVTAPVSYAVWLYNSTGATVAQIQAAIASELSAYFKARPIGGDRIDGFPGSVYASELSAVIGRAKISGAPLPIIRVVLSAPAADVALSDGQVPVLGAIGAAINQLNAAGL